MKRIVIVGTTGSGKTTLGEQLSQILRLPAVDLDTLYWLPNWQGETADVFRDKVSRVVASAEWIICGNYSSVRDLIWSRADTVIWLDYSLWLTQWRLLQRTIKRIISQEDLWGTGNRESWRSQFFSCDSLFLWAIKTYKRRRYEYPALFAQTKYAHLNVLILKSPNATKLWKQSIEGID